MTVKVAVKKHDLGIGKLRAQVAELAATTITTGWQGPSGSERHGPDSPATNSEIATYHEFGTVRMPARPVVRITYERHSKQFRDHFKRQVSALIDQRTDFEGAIASMGGKLVDELRAEIDRAKEWAAALAQSTIDAKGHDRPLIETETLKRKASWAQRSKADDSIVRQGGEQ